MATAPHFKLSARETRGGWRGVASLGDGVVALKTMPVFREKQDALDAIRAWVQKHDAHADRHISRGRFTRSTRIGDRRIAYRERKLIPRKFFALPARAPGKGSLPLADPKKGWRYDPAHVRNAAARLAQMVKRGSVTTAEAREAERNIMRAACDLGIERTCKRLIAKAAAPIRMAAYSR